MNKKANPESEGSGWLENDPRNSRETTQRDPKAAAASLKQQGDPLRITGTTRQQHRRASEVEKLLKGTPLAKVRGKGKLSRRAFEAGATVHRLFLAGVGGVRGIDFTQEKVDGGRFDPQHQFSGSIDAWRQLAAMIEESRMGDRAAAVVLRVAGQEEQLVSVALDFETNEKLRAQGKCSRITEGVVSQLLRDGLEALGAANSKRAADRLDRKSQAVLSWMEEGARPSTTTYGDRPDLGKRK